ncbi:hypothetical protein Cp4435_00413 [Clostridium perfringens]|nr:hypothetical protein [Clostridium perfringens]MDG6883269.1 hypothetical protein [Clostridium perfringens]
MEYKVEYENPRLQYYILRIIYISIILSSIIFIKKEDYIIFYKFLDLCSVIMLGTSLLIGISSNIDKEKNLISYTNIGIFWLLIPEIFYSFTSLELYVVDKMIVYKIIGLLFQYFIVFVIALGKKKNFNFKKINKIFLILNITFNITYLLVINNVKLMKVFIKDVYIYNLMFILIVIFFLILLIVIVVDKENTSDKFFYYLIFYLLVFSVGNIIFLDNLHNLRDTYLLGVCFSQILDFSSCYILVEGIIRFSLNKNFNTINRIMLFKRSEFDRNNRYLRKKIEELKELENLLDREELLFNKINSAIGDYIFISKGEKLFYLNDEALEFLEVENKESILFESMEVLYEKILEKQVYLKEKGSMDSYKEIIFKNIKGGYSNGEFYTIPFGDNYKIIIINDITKKNNALRLNKYLKYKLEEENIKG